MSERISPDVEWGKIRRGMDEVIRHMRRGDVAMFPLPDEHGPRRSLYNHINRRANRLWGATKYDMQVTLDGVKLVRHGPDPEVDSYVRNCYLQPRVDDEGYMFERHDDGTMTARLDGYAIVPKEDWEARGALIHQLEARVDALSKKNANQRDLIAHLQNVAHSSALTMKSRGWLGRMFGL